MFSKKKYSKKNQKCFFKGVFVRIIEFILNKSKLYIYSARNKFKLVLEKHKIILQL